MENQPVSPQNPLVGTPVVPLYQPVEAPVYKAKKTAFVLGLIGCILLCIDWSPIIAPTLGIIGLVKAGQEKKRAAQHGATLPRIVKVGRILSLISLIGGILSLLAYIVLTIISVIGVIVSGVAFIGSLFAFVAEYAEFFRIAFAVIQFVAENKETIEFIFSILTSLLNA